MQEDELLEVRYEIKQQIAKGGMAEIYLVWDKKLEKQWVLKKIILSKEEMWKKDIFERETEFLKRVSYPAFPVMVDCLEGKDACYIVMEYIKGENLEQILKRKKRLPLAQAVSLMGEAAEALNYLHHFMPPIIYGDLKPSNLIVTRQGIVKMVDFGAVSEGENRFAFGTTQYAAPEQLAKGKKNLVTKSSDIYAFGAMFYEVLSGEKFQGQYLENPFIPAKIRELIFTCTRMRKEERYQDMGEVISILRGSEKESRFGKRKQRFLIQERERQLLTMCDEMLFWKDIEQYR